MSKLHRPVLTAFFLIAIFALCGCVSSASTPEFANAKWVATNPISINIKYALAAAKNSLTLTATDTNDNSNIGNLSVKITQYDPKTRRIQGSITAADGVYEDLSGTAYIKYEYLDAAGKGDMMYVAISDVSYDDFEIQLNYMKR